MTGCIMKINWFSPLPPARTEIAHYSARIMKALSIIAEVVLWTDQNEWDKSLEETVVVRRFSIEAVPWAELNSADLNVYHIGNNPQYHGAIWQISRKLPGVIVLHDLVLQGFLSNFLPPISGDLPSYTALMAYYYGAGGKAAAGTVCRGEQSCDALAGEFPLYDPAVDNCLGIIVHSRTAFETIAQRQKWPVFLLDLPYKTISGIDPEQLPVKRVEPPFHIIIFGYIGQNRRVDSILEALSTLSCKDSFILDVYGELWIDDLLPERLESLGLGDVVRFHGYVAETELDAALAASDLAINLRFPSFGEASSSQLRIWAHALPTIVTRTGWYADQTDGSLIFVDPGNMVADLRSILNSFLDCPEMFAGKGMSGRKILFEKHLPEVYVDSLLEVFAGIELMKSRALVNLMVRRVAEQIAALSVDLSADIYSGRVAQEINKTFAEIESGLAL